MAWWLSPSRRLPARLLSRWVPVAVVPDGPVYHPCHDKCSRLHLHQESDYLLSCQSPLLSAVRSTPASGWLRGLLNQVVSPELLPIVDAPGHRTNLWVSKVRFVAAAACHLGWTPRYPCESETWKRNLCTRFEPRWWLLRAVCRIVPDYAHKRKCPEKLLYWVVYPIARRSPGASESNLPLSAGSLNVVLSQPGMRRKPAASQ